MIDNLFDTPVAEHRQPDMRDFVGSVLESSTRMAAVACNCDGLILLWNAGACSTYGYQADEMLGCSNWESLFASRDVLAGRPHEILRVAFDQGIWEGPIFQIRKNRVCFRAEVVVTPWLDHDGHQIGFLMLAREVEDRPESRWSDLSQAMREVEERFHSAFEYTNVAMVLTDLNNRFVRVNDAFVRMFGYDADEMLSMSMGDITHPDDLQESYRLREALLDGGVNYFQMEKRYRHRSGRIIWALTNVAIVRDANGKPSLYLGQVQDISQRKHAEEALRLAQNRVQYLVSSSPAVLFTLSATEGSPQITWIGGNIRDIMGYTPEDALRRDWWRQHLHPDDLQSINAQIRFDLPAHDRTACEFRFRHLDGRYRWMRSELRLLRDFDGVPQEIVGSWSDVTERKHLEDQFRQSQKMEAVGRLAGGIAHDFNNLLTVINGYSEMLVNIQPPGDPFHDFADQILKAGMRAAALTRQLLTFSRKQVIAPVVIDLNSLLAEMEKMLSRVIGEDIELRLHTRPDLWKVRVDPGQIEQVLMNLVVNARDAMPQGGKLTIETENVELGAGIHQQHPDARPGQFVCLSVSDTGCGMDDETKARIFEPFFTTKAPDKGSGLGLATVYGIVTQSDGRIEVCSEKDVGATFKIYLPRDTREAIPASSSSAIFGPYRGTETVLLVEDEDGVRKFARILLEKHGYRVIEARNGGEGLLLCQHHPHPIDIMITDVVMPAMSGRTLAELLAGIRPNLKVLYLSGYTDEAIVHHGVIDPDTPFLQKPFTIEALARKVREVLDADKTPSGG